jgi:N utilization substance protein B
MDSNQTGPEDAARGFRDCFDPSHDGEKALGLDPKSFNASWPMALELFYGAAKSLPELDAAIEKAADNWSLGRMAKVDLALIRLALYEMRHREDIPPKVSLNEALEISKSYGDAESTAFVNGVLARLLSELP